jgi:hypothetical protein
MNNYIINKIEWTEHLFWELGWMYLAFLKGNFDGGVEMYYWIIVHLTYKGECTGKIKIPFWQIVKNKLVVLIGIVITFGLLFIIGTSIFYGLN